MPTAGAWTTIAARDRPHVISSTIQRSRSGSGSINLPCHSFRETGLEDDVKYDRLGYEDLSEQSLTAGVIALIQQCDSQIYISSQGYDAGTPTNLGSDNAPPAFLIGSIELNASLSCNLPRNPCRIACSQPIKTSHGC